MDNSQPVEAYIRIAHSIEEQLMISRFTARQRRILDLILRLSWGCNKKAAYIPRQKDFEVAGISESHIKVHLEWLERSRVIFREGEYYSFNKDFAQWRVSQAFKYSPEKLRELIRINLSAGSENLPNAVVPGRAAPEADGGVKDGGSNDIAGAAGLPFSASSGLPKGEEKTSAKGKFTQSELASAKEILNKNKIMVIYPDNYLGEKGETGERGAFFRTAETAFSEENKKQSEAIWQKVLGALKTQVSGANYRTWLEKSQAQGTAGKKFIVGVPDRFTADYLSKNLRSLVEKTLIEQAGELFQVSFTAEVMRQPANQQKGGGV
jgi:hypothetical protein